MNPVVIIADGRKRTEYVPDATWFALKLLDLVLERPCGCGCGLPALRYSLETFQTIPELAVFVPELDSTTASSGGFHRERSTTA